MAETDADTEFESQKVLKSVVFQLSTVERDGNTVELSAIAGTVAIRIITEVRVDGNDLILTGLHIDGPGPGSTGLRILRELARDLGRQFSAQRVIIYGGVRTTGGNPSHLPRPIIISVGA